MMMTHCQRVEEIHAGFQRRSQGSPGISPAKLCASLNLSVNLRLFNVWEAREFARLYWNAHHAFWLLQTCDVSAALKKHGKAHQKHAAVYHALPVQMFRSIESTHALLLRWEAGKKSGAKYATGQVKMVMDLFRRFENKVISVRELPCSEAGREIVPAVTYDEKQLVQVAMACAARPIVHNKVTGQFANHTFLKIVKTHLHSRFNMVKVLFFSFFPLPPTFSPPY